MADLAIVIAVRNGAGTISGALDSIARAVNRGAQVYVFDAESQDDTMDIVLAQMPNAHYKRRKDGGLYFAWNVAISCVTEPFLYFLNCDDRLVLDDTMAGMLETLRADHELTAVHGKTRMRRADGALRYAGKPILRDDFVGDMPIVTPASVFRVAHLREAGGFDTHYAISADYDFVLGLLQKQTHAAFRFVDAPVTDFSLDGMSNRQRAAAFAQIREIIRKRLGMGGYLRHLVWYAANQSKRVLLSAYFTVRGTK